MPLDIRFDYAFNVADSLALAAAVLLPFIRNIFRRYRVESQVRYLNLLKTKTEIEQFLNDKKPEEYPVIGERLRRTLLDIEGEIGAIEKRDHVFINSLFLFAAELFLISGFILTGFFQRLRFALFEKSSATGITFFEGILKYPEIRILLLMGVVAVSVFISHVVLRRYPVQTSRRYARYAYYLGTIHFVAGFVLTAVFGFLYITDPISSIW